MTGQEAVELIRQEAWTGRKPGLSRTRELLKRVGNPHQSPKCARSLPRWSQIQG